MRKLVSKGLSFISVAGLVFYVAFAFDPDPWDNDVFTKADYDRLIYDPDCRAIMRYAPEGWGAWFYVWKDRITWNAGGILEMLGLLEPVMLADINDRYRNLPFKDQPPAYLYGQKTWCVVLLRRK